MTWPGYFALGDDQIATAVELVNTGRALSYMEQFNEQVRMGLRAGPCINWIGGCDNCPDINIVLTDGKGYLGIPVDPAPWYKPNNEDSERFWGVIGLEASGVDDSTAQASVFRSIGVGGVAGRSYRGPRTITVRAMAVAEDECGLAYGLEWLRETYEDQAGVLNECGGDNLIHLDCCPTCGLADEPGQVFCNPESYAELGPASPPVSCGANWWPTTYKQLRDGPFNDPYWCRWYSIYRHLRDGLPEFSCFVDECLTDHVRQFQGVRLVEGPAIIRTQRTSSGNWFAEFDFIVLCANPDPVKFSGLQAGNSLLGVG